MECTPQVIVQAHHLLRSFGNNVSSVDIISRQLGASAGRCKEPNVRRPRRSQSPQFTRAQNVRRRRCALFSLGVSDDACVLTMTWKRNGTALGQAGPCAA